MACQFAHLYQANVDLITTALRRDFREPFRFDITFNVVRRYLLRTHSVIITRLVTFYFGIDTFAFMIE